MLLVFVVHLLIVTANQGNAFDTLWGDGRDALLHERYAEAERLLKAALTELRRSEGIDNTQRANVMNDLAEACRYLGRYGEAESLYKQSIALLRKEPQSTRALVIVLNNFGGMLKIKQQFARAGEYYEESLKLATRALPANDAFFGTILNGLAALSFWKGDFRTAEKQLERALRIREEALGVESLEVAETLNGLGNVQVRRKKVSEGEANLRRSLALMEKRHGSRHGDVAAALNNLAVALHEQKKFTEAEAVLLRALDIYRTEVPAGDTRSADAQFNLAELFISQKRFVEAESLLKEAVTIRTSSYRPIGDDDAFTYERYAFVLKRLGRTAEADSAAARARSMRLELRYTFRP